MSKGWIIVRQYKNAQVGDTVRVQFKTIEEDSERIQSFEGTMIKVRGSGPGQTITVRKISFGVGVERVFPVASPRFAGLAVLRHGKVRRSKLYFMRKLTGKAHKLEFKAEEPALEPAPQSAGAETAASAPAPGEPGKAAIPAADKAGSAVPATST
ncbi:MAG: 50S ribosomal protein L19 [Elusimicrobia bacterium]|nr:50S ribosomal protein L19 [Elusimicrobiota bacterium]